MELNTYKCDVCGKVKEPADMGWFLVWDDSANVWLPREFGDDGKKRQPQVYVASVFHIAFWSNEAARGTKITHACSEHCVMARVETMCGMAATSTADRG